MSVLTSAIIYYILYYTMLGFLALLEFEINYLSIWTQIRLLWNSLIRVHSVCFQYVTWKGIREELLELAPIRPLENTGLMGASSRSSNPLPSSTLKKKPTNKENMAQVYRSGSGCNPEHILKFSFSHNAAQVPENGPMLIDQFCGQSPGDPFLPKYFSLRDF